MSPMCKPLQREKPRPTWASELQAGTALLLSLQYIRCLWPCCPLLAALCVNRLGRGVLPATMLERCEAWCDQGGTALMREKTGESRAVLSSCVSILLAHPPWKPHDLSTEGADRCHLGPTVRTGHDSPVWFLHFRNCHNWEWSLKHSFFYTSSEDHVSCPSLPDCGQKTSTRAPGHLVA